MDLKDFIKDTIKSISKAAVELQDELGPDGVIVNPPRASSAGSESYDVDSPGSRFRQIERVSFDVALTAESSAKGGGGLQVAWIGVGASAGGEVADRSERVSRVTFSISIALPPSVYEETIRKRREDAAGRNETETDGGSWKTA